MKFQQQKIYFRGYRELIYKAIIICESPMKFQQQKIYFRGYRELIYKAIII